MRSGQISKQGHGNFSSISLAKILINEIENILVVFMHRYSKKQYSTNTVLKREKERERRLLMCAQKTSEKKKRAKQINRTVWHIQKQEKKGWVVCRLKCRIKELSFESNGF